MSHNFLIGIGGTGARVIESMIYLCAAGYGPEELSLFIIDPDEGNGNLNRTKALIALYQKCHKNFNPTSSTDKKLFKTTIKTPPSTLVWNIFKEKNVRLKDYIGHETLPDDLKNFASVLFTDKELTTPLNKGFRGHPSIGSVVMSNPPEDEEPWSLLWEDMGDRKQYEISAFLVGSVFGGTGAAGVPTTGSRELIKFNPKAKIGENKSRVLLGGALVLPYFSFEKEDTDEELFVTKDDFPIATKAALHYYNEKELGFDQLYFVGDSLNQKVGKFSPGSQTQENKPHYIEIVTTLAAVDFYGQPPIEDESENQYFIACRDNEIIRWDSLPVSRNSQNIRSRQFELKSCLVNMSTFAYTFCTYGKEILDRNHKVIDDFWYRKHFKFNDSKEKDRVKNPRRGDNYEQIKDFDNFLRQFLLWICLIDDDTNKVELFNKKQIIEGEIQLGSPINLKNPNVHKDSIGVFLKEGSNKQDFGSFINNALNIVDVTGEKKLSASNKYINVFYEAATKFSKANYKIQ